MRKKLLIFIVLNLLCSFILPLSPVRALTTPYRIVNTVLSASSDVYYTSAGSFFNDTDYVYIRHKYYDCYVGVKFADLSMIPDNATVVSAYLSLYSDMSPDSYTSLTVTLYGFDMDSAPVFDDETDLLSNNHTSAYVNWNSKVLHSSAYYNTSNLLNVVNEVRDRAGFVSSDGLAFYILGAKTGNQYSRYFNSVEEGNGPKLYISYSIPYSSPPYKLPPIVNSTYVCENGTWQFGTFINNTDYYELFQVWNDTQENMWLVNFYDGAQNDLYLYDSEMSGTKLYDDYHFTGTHDWYSWACVDDDGVGYFLAYQNTGTDILQLFRINSASSVTKLVDVKTQDTITEAFCEYDQRNNDIWILYTYNNLGYYAVYDLDSSTLTTTATLTGYTTEQNIYIPTFGNKVFFIGNYYSGANKYGFSEFTIGTGFGAKTEIASAYQYIIAVDGYCSGSDYYVLVTLRNSNDDVTNQLFLNGASIDQSTLLTGTAYATATYFSGGVGYGLYYYDATPDVMKLYNKDLTNPYTDHVEDYLTQDNLAISYFHVFNGYSAHGNINVDQHFINENVLDYNGVTAWGTGTEIRRIQPVVVGLVSDTYYQIHFFNCTWTDPFPEYDPEDWDYEDDEEEEEEEDVNEVNALLNADNLLLLIGLIGIAGVPVTINIAILNIRSGNYSTALGVLLLGIMGCYTMIVTWLGS